jgi:hypothetical protein
VATIRKHPDLFRPALLELLNDDVTDIVVAILAEVRP